MSSLSPFLRGEGWGEGQTHGRRALLDLYSFTRIASFDAMQPLPTSGARLQPTLCAALLIDHAVWVPAFAGTTVGDSAGNPYFLRAIVHSASPGMQVRQTSGRMA